MRRSSTLSLTVGLVLVSLLVTAGDADDRSPQLDRVRARIVALEARLEELGRERAGASAERVRLEAELELAEARVRELELVLGRSRDEAVDLRDEASRLGEELEQRRRALSLHLEMLSLLGRPGPLQLHYDAARGGNLEQSLGTVAVLTSGQARLMGEYLDLEVQRGQRLAELSRIMAGAQREAAELVSRRGELAALRDRAAARLKELERSERRTTDVLAEMREREQALGRLMVLLGEERRGAGGGDIRRLRGALPWPAPGRVVQSFGRHYLPKYATYTLCNGVRLDVPSGTPVTAVFGGVVAYAQHFKGYGNMVVVDHGQQVFSLAAGLATILVRANQRVSMGLQLGLAPPPTAEGNIYLEVRVGGRPEDPQRWLQLEEGRSRS